MSELGADYVPGRSADRQPERGFPQPHLSAPPAAASSGAREWSRQPVPCPARRGVGLEMAGRRGAPGKDSGRAAVGREGALAGREAAGAAPAGPSSTFSRERPGPGGWGTRGWGGLRHKEVLSGNQHTSFSCWGDQHPGELAWRPGCRNAVRDGRGLAPPPAPPAGPKQEEPSGLPAGRPLADPLGPVLRPALSPCPLPSARRRRR